MNKKELEILAKQKSNVISRILKSKHKPLYDEINKIEADKFSEKLYIFLYGNHVGCKYCGKKTRFIKFNEGYSTYCSSSCMAKDTAIKRSKSIKKTFQERYGVNSPSQLKSTKDKIKRHRKNGRYDNVVEAMKKTKKEKYGDENYSNVEQTKQTKLQKYGDESYNNREKAKNTIRLRYNDTVSPATRQSTIKRLQSKEIGFKSKKYNDWLSNEGIDNVSQLQYIKHKKQQTKLKRTLDIVKNRLKDYVELLFDEESFDGVGGYDKKFKFKCKKCGNVFEDYLYSGHIPRCETCYPKRNYSSVGEFEILYFIKDILPDETVLHKDRKLIGAELDIYLPQRKLAIEFNGIYWHSENHGGKDKNYHINKTKLCHDKGVKLIHINDIDWIYKQDIIKNRLQHMLIRDSKIYARNCKIKSVSSSEKSKFLNKYHIQGTDKSQINYGLYFNGDLVSIMTFGSLRKELGYKTPKTDEYEMYRYCSNTNVIGGASKILNHFIKTHNPDKIITYSDNRWGYTNFYEKIGFKYISETPCSYWYFDNKINKKQLYHRSTFQKHKLPKLLEKFDTELTEWENMQLNGYDRIWDCGNLKFVWKREFIHYERQTKS